MNDAYPELLTTSRWSETETLPLVVGVDLGGTQIRTAVMRGPKLLSRTNLLTGENPTPERVVPRIRNSIRQALQEAGVTIDQTAGIGIGAPGPIDRQAGIVCSPANLPGWTNYHLRDAIATEFDVPIFLENDANVAALSEYMFGAGRGSQEIIYITISTGIGAGVISNGQILQGCAATAGELGHMTIDIHGLRCNCGNVGCWETISSGTAIARRAHTLIALGKGENLLNYALRQGYSTTEADTPSDHQRAIHYPAHLNARDIAEAAAAGIPEARQIIAEAAEGLGYGLINVIHIFNPERIILGGSVIKIGAPLLEPAKRIVAEHAMRAPREGARILLTELGANVGIIGAGALIYYNN